MTPETQAAADLTGVAIRLRNWLDAGYDEPYYIAQFREDLRTLLATLDPTEQPTDEATETRTEWANLMRFADGREEITHPVGETLARERRRRFPKLHVALLQREVRYGPWTNGETGSAVTARHRPLTDEPCDVTLTERGRQAVLDYRAIRREQHPRPRP